MGTLANGRSRPSEWVFPRSHSLGAWESDSLPGTYLGGNQPLPREAGRWGKEDGFPRGGEHPPTVGDQGNPLTLEDVGESEVLIVRTTHISSSDLCEGSIGRQTGSTEMAYIAGNSLGSEQVPSSYSRGSPRRYPTREWAVRMTRYAVEGILGLSIGFGLWNGFSTPQVPVRMPHFPIGEVASDRAATSVR